MSFPTQEPLLKTCGSCGRPIGYKGDKEKSARPFGSWICPECVEKLLRSFRGKDA